MAAVPEKCPCVYVIAEDGNPGVCKLGMTESLNRRIGTLQTSNWRKLTVYAAFQVETAQLAKKVEGELLKYCSSLILRGEWLSVSPKNMKWYIKVHLSMMPTMPAIFDLVEGKQTELVTAFGAAL